MELVGIVRCPVGSLLPYGEGRQINPDAVKRLAKYFEKTKCTPEKEDNFIRAIITPDDLRQIVSTLQVSENTLKRTTLQKTYPLLSGHTIACLDGRHRIRAAIKHKPLSWWVVKLLCVQGSWIEFPLKIALASIDPQIIQDQIEATSREDPYSDAEVYRLVRKYMKNHDKARVEDCLSRLSAPKQVSLKGLLKRPQLVRDLDALIKFPGVIGGLQLGNIHKYLALHCDENFSFPLQNILKIWEFITDDDPRVNAAVDVTTVKYLQFRAPITSHGDRMAIDRMFDQGTLLEGIKDLDLRDRIRKRVLSVQVIIPSVETFHENMKYVLMGAKILRKYLMEVPTCKRNKPTLFESLASKWKSPGTQYVEYDYGKFMQTCEAPTAWHAYTTVFLAALREFARLSFEHPRQDIRGETMPAFPEGPQINYLARLALQVGFDNLKIQETLKTQSGHPGVAQYKPQDGRPADWRGGIPFTKSYIQLRSQAFLPQLAGPVSRGNAVSTLFVIRDVINAFFGANSRIMYEDPYELSPLNSLPVDEASNDFTTFTPPEIGRLNQDENTIMEELGNDGSVDALEMQKRNQTDTSNTVRPRARRIEKKRRKSQAPKKPISKITHRAGSAIDTPQRTDMMQTENFQVDPSNEPQHTILRDTGRTPPMSGIAEESYMMQTETDFSTEQEQFESAVSGALEAESPRELGHTILREHDRTPRTSAEPEIPIQTETGSIRKPEQLQSIVDPVTLQSEPPRELEETMFRETSRNAPLTFSVLEESDPVQKASQTESSSLEHQQAKSPTSAGSSRSHISTMPNRSDRSPTTHTSSTRPSRQVEVTVGRETSRANTPESDRSFPSHASTQDRQNGLVELAATETAEAQPSTMPSLLQDLERVNWEAAFKPPQTEFSREAIDQARAPETAQASPSRGLEMPDRSGRFTVVTPVRYPVDTPLGELTNRKRKLESGTNTPNEHNSSAVSRTSVQHQEASMARGHNSVVPIRGMQPQRHQPGGDARMETEIRIRLNEQQRATKRLRLTKPDGA
ncbi:hypothetical protein AUP68_05460 [Ilyonectria robusta]